MRRHSLIWLTTTVCILLAFVAATMQRKDEGLFKHTREFPEILWLIEQAYVDEVNLGNMMPGAFQGVLDEVDENASYLEPGMSVTSQRQAARARTGLTLTRRHGYAFVLTSDPGSPAAEAGIRSGAYIYKVADKSTRSMNLHALEHLLAKPTDSLTLSVVPAGEMEEIRKTLTPKAFPAPRLKHERPREGVSLIAIPTRYPQLAEDLKAAIDKSAADTLILDLRQNAMGDDQDFQILANTFLPTQTLGQWRGPKEAIEPVKHQGKPLFGGSLHILISHGTSAAAERFAAVAAEVIDAVLVGEETLGIPARYELLPLKSGGYIKISTHAFVLPSNTMLDGEGVKPSLQVKDTQDAQEWLKKALDLIEKGTQAEPVESAQ